MVTIQWAIEPASDSAYRFGQSMLKQHSSASNSATGSVSEQLFIDLSPLNVVKLGQREPKLAQKSDAKSDAINDFDAESSGTDSRELK